MRPRDRGRRRGPLLVLAVLPAVAAVALLPSAASIAEQATVAQEDTTTTTAPPTTTTTQPPTTTTQPPTTTTTAPPPTTTTSTSTTTSTTTSSTTTTTVATTLASSSDDDSGIPGWVWLGLAALAVLALIAWLVARYVQQRGAATRWATQSQVLLDEAQRAHDDSVDLLARWSTLGPDQLAQRWSTEMEQLQRVRSHLGRHMANAPDAASARPIERIASAVDDLRIALGQTDLGNGPGRLAGGPVPPPPTAASAAGALQEAIDHAQHPDAPR